MAITTDLEIYRGEDRTLSFVQSPEEDISSWELEFNLSRAKNTSSQIITRACDLTLPLIGKFKCDLTSADTEALPVGVYQWDVWRVNTGLERLIGIGKFTVLPNVRIPA